MVNTAGDATQSAVIPLLRYVDNAQLFLLQLSLAVIHQLENDPFVTNLKQVCQPEFAQYLGEINPRNLTRYMNLTKIADFIAREASDAQDFRGFDYWRKVLVDQGLASRQVEKGGGWAGFGGVHSHYTFTDVGAAFFNLQACLLVQPSIAPELYKKASTLDMRRLSHSAAEMILLTHKQVSLAAHFSSQSKSFQSLLVGTLYYLGKHLSRNKETPFEELWSHVEVYSEGKVTKDEFNACLVFLNDYIRGGSTIKPTKEGEAIFYFLGELIQVRENQAILP